MEPIEDYIQKSLSGLKDEINNRFADVEHVEKKKDSVNELISLEVGYITNMAFDKLIDLKMRHFKDVLKENAPSKITDFYEFNLRDEMNMWIQNPQNKFKPNPENVKYSFDPAVKNGVLIGGAVLCLGAIYTYKVFLKSVLLGSISGAGTILLTALSYKYTKNRFITKSINTAKNDAHQFIKGLNDQLTLWIKTISKEVDYQFNNFCDANSINLK